MEVAIVTFGGRVTRLVEFVTATKFEPPTLQPIGGTPMGEAITTALDMIEERKASYREHGIAYYRPWAFLITDGEPNDHWKPVISRVQDGEKKKSFCFFAVGVEGANMNVLEEICVRKPLWLQGMKFRELFSWLSNSQQAVSRSSPGDEVPLEDPTSGPKGWAASIGWQPCGDTLPKACKGRVTWPTSSPCQDCNCVRVFGEAADADARRLRRRRRRQREVQRRRLGDRLRDDHRERGGAL